MGKGFTFWYPPFVLRSCMVFSGFSRHDLSILPGLIYAYLMVKSGNIILVMIMHALSNLFGSILIQFFIGVSKEATIIYMILLMSRV